MNPSNGHLDLLPNRPYWLARLTWAEQQMDRTTLKEHERWREVCCVYRHLASCRLRHCAYGSGALCKVLSHVRA